MVSNQVEGIRDERHAIFGRVQDRNDGQEMDQGTQLRRNGNLVTGQIRTSVHLRT